MHAASRRATAIAARAAASAVARAPVAAVAARLASRNAATSTPLPPEWVKLAAEDLGGKPAESLVWKSPEGIAVKPVYTAEDVKARG